MKKNYFLIVLLCTAIFVKAQPTVTSSIAGGIGDVISLSEVDATGFDPGAAGADVTWDFTGITLTGLTSGYTLVDPAVTGVAASFPGANVAGETGGGNYAFFKITTSEFTNYGAYTPTVTASYSDPETLYTFPLTYNATGSDNLYCEFTSGYDFVRSGSVSFTVDGYGTLKLPSGNYNNVLRLLVHETYSDEAVGLPVTIDYDFNNYYWVMEGTIGPVFEYMDMTITTGGFPSATEAAYVNADIVVPTGIELPAITGTVSIYPNPAADIIYIAGASSATASSVAIYDMTGKLVSMPDIANGDGNISSADISVLPAGIYSLQIVTDAGTTAKQFAVEK